MKIRTLIADDHTLVCECLCAVLEKFPEIELVGRTADGGELVPMTCELRPDLVIMDIGMRELSGVDIVRRIIASSPGTKVLLLSTHADRKFVSDALKAGACGLLLKSCTGEEMMTAIRTVVRDGTYLSADLHGHELSEAHSLGAARAHDAVLTPREEEVLLLLARGKSSKAIAEHLGISSKTVETHRMHVMKKLKLTSIAGLTKYALRERLLPLE